MKRAAAKSAVATLLRTIQVPEIGALWSEQGGTFVGIGRRQGETRDHVLILPKLSGKSGTWEQSNEYAKSLKVGDHADFEPAQREDGALCYANVGHLFEKRAYWLAPQSAYDERWAWYQRFSYGNQYDTTKVNQLRLFAVRRFPI